MRLIELSAVKFGILDLRQHATDRYGAIVIEHLASGVYWVRSKRGAGQAGAITSTSPSTWRSPEPGRVTAGARKAKATC